MRWYIYGEVFFTTNAKRNSASKRMDNIAARAGFTPGAWSALLSAYGTWPDGKLNINGTSDTGATVPGIRFCYWTENRQDALDAEADITNYWDFFSDTDSWWSMTAAPGA